MNGLTDVSATVERRHGRLVVAACLFGLLFAVVAYYYVVSTYQGEPDSRASVDGAPTGDSQRRRMIEDLVAEIAAHSRDGGTAASIQAPPSRELPPSPADPRRAGAQRPPPPDGFAYPTFERAGMPTQSGDTGSEKADSPQAPEWLSSPDSLAAVAANAAAAGRDWSFGWVRLGADARLEDAVAELAALGIVVEGQAGDLLRARLPGDPGRLRAVGELAAVDGLGAQPPSAKLPAAFAEETRGKPAHEIVPVFVTLAAADDGDGRWRAALERLGAVVGAYDAHTRSYTANVEYGGIDALAASDFVVFVEPVGIVEAANDTAVPAMGADAYRTYTDAEGWGGTAGQNVAVGVMDTGLNINHLDIESGRLSVCGANFVPSFEEEQDLWVDADGHGTHVAATVAGNGAADRRYAGMAPLAPHIRFAKVLNKRGFGASSWIFPGMDFLAEASSCGAAGWTDDAVAPPIVNMSLSARSLTFEGRDTSARKLDAVVWDTGQLYVVANANSGIHGFSNYGAAKNSLAVGAAWDSGELASFSSHGPTADGRLAPLVVGTGVNVYSARGDGSRGAYVRYNGTSMSSPSVAGVAALAMDAEPDLVGNAALARAHLMASAVKPDAWLDAEDAFPSDNTNGPGALHGRYGLGKVSGSTGVLDRPRDDGWESGGWHGIELDAGHTAWHVIDVPRDASRLDVVLTWDEPPADVIANTVLNDLDLWLEQPFPLSRDADIGSESRRDNVEWVIVRNPRAGQWEARVEAERVHGERPRAALAYTIIRGPSMPQLSIVADSDTLDANGNVELTVSTDGYVAAGTRLVMDCRTVDNEPCEENGTYEEVRDDAPATGPLPIVPGGFVALGEIRVGQPRTVRVRGLMRGENDRMHFTVTGWNARGASTVVFAEEADAQFAAPANDDFANASDLAGSVEGDLLTATTEPGEPPFQDGTERPAASVWYRWKAKAAGAVHFSLAPAEAFSYSPQDRWYDEFEMRLDVYQGDSVAGAREVASAPWGASFLAEEDGEYLVRVAGRARAAPFALTWREGGAPGNDAFDVPVALEGGEGQVKGTNAGATLEPGEQFGPLAATVWYEWAAPDDGWYAFGSSAAHLKVLAFRDATAVDDLRLVSGFPEEEIRFRAKAGDTYRVAVASRDAESAGTEFELSWAALEEHGSSNDLLENAWAFPEADSSSRWVAVGPSETVEPGEPPESGVRTEWWSWTPPAQGEYTWRLDADPLHLTAFKGDALDALFLIGSNDGPTGEFSFEADEGEQYRFSVAAAREHAFTTRYPGGTVVWGPTPENDTWSRAAVLDTAAGTFAASNRYATIEQGEHIHDVGHSSLWWSFEAPEAGWYRFWIEERSLPFTLAAYADDPAAPPGRLVMIASSERGLNDGIEVFLHAGNADARFAVRVGTLGDAEGRGFTLRWEASDPPVWLRYAGRTDQRYEYHDDGETVDVADFRSLVFDGTGRALYASTNRGVAVFDRTGDNGSLNFVDLIRGGETHPHLFWDAPRSRLLALGGSSFRVYAPVGGDTLDLEDEGSHTFPSHADNVVGAFDRNYDVAFAHPTGSFLYTVNWGGHSQTRIYSIDEDGAMGFVQQVGRRLEAGAVSNAGRHVYGVESGILRVFESADTGELTELASLSLPHAHDAVVVGDDDSRVFTWGAGGSAVVDVTNPAQPTLLGSVALPVDPETSSRYRRCFASSARTGRPAADAFCANGDAYAVAWRDGMLAPTDLVADWRANRYNDFVPDFGQSFERRGFAMSPDGRHAYASTLDHGIAVFERVNNADDLEPGTITVTIAADTSPVAEGMSADFTLTRTDSAGPLTVNVDVTESGAMIEGTAPQTVTFGDGTATAMLNVPTEDDAADEPDSDITAKVTAGADYEPGDPDSAMVTVTDDDPGSGVATVTIAAGTSPVGEGTAAEFTLTRTDSTGALTVNVDVTESGAMIEGTAPTTMEFADGETTAPLNVPTEDDAVDEPNSEITATVSAGTGYAPGTPGSASVTVTDDDDPGSGRVSFAAERVVASDTDGATSVYAADLDGDGDPDVLSASEEDDTVAWYENLGAGAFSAKRVISAAVDKATSVYAADLDGDGDPDVLLASGFSSANAGRISKIAWYENLGSADFAAERVISTAAEEPTSVFAADLDGDGDADVLSTSAADDKLAWYENLGNKEFSGQRVISTEASVRTSTHAVDLDGDGDADVLSTSQNDDKVAWYENLGGGTFSTQRVITTDADGARAVHAADLDGDGYADVLTASASDDKIAWHENLGGGAFSAQRVISLDADFAASVYATDLDGDGDSDVVSASGLDDKIAWYENLGEGAFSAQRVISSSADGAQAVHAGDLDGDGDPDVLFASVNDDTVGWYENQSDHGDDHGDEPEAATLATVFPAFLHGVVESGGDRDVFRFATGSGTLKVYSNGPTDTFGTLLDADGEELASNDDAQGSRNFLIETEVEAGVHYVEVRGWSTTTGPYTLSIEFVAADDDVSAAVTVTMSADSPTVIEGESADFALTRSDSAGPLTVNVEVVEVANMIFGIAPTTVAFVDGETTAALSVATEDDTVDERDSVVTATVTAGTGYDPAAPDSASVTVLDNDDPMPGDDSFAAEWIVTTDADGAVSVFAADLDGDGDPDVLSASELDDKIAWYENDGGELSDERVITTAADTAESVHAADLDGDGDLDVLSASFRDSKIAWYENEGGGVFSAQQVITTDANGARSVHAADLDGDGDADVLSASTRDDRIAWYENEGGGAFSAQRVIATANGSSVHAVDLDGDGDADVAYASWDEDTVAWHENLGGGVFSAQRVVAANADDARSVHAADFDGDGDADLLSASQGDDKVAWYENLGAGTFSVGRVITTAADGARSVHAADLDGDGDPDVLSASWDDNKVAWYENDGNGGFAEQHVVASAADGAHSVHAADLDGDGDADVLSASFRDDKVAWYENLSDHGDDHGDAPASATLATAFPAFLHGVLESDGDNDVFRFATGSGRLKAYANGPTNTYGWLLDEQGDFLAGDDPLSGNFLVEAEVEAGVHYVQVFGPDNETGPYTLSIEFVADDGGVTFAAERAVATDVDGASSVHAADLDGDGDPDVLFASQEDGEIAWQENLGGGSFSAPRDIATTGSAAGEATSVHAADLDGDGDADVLSTSRYGENVAWYENLGGGEFSAQRDIDSSPYMNSVHAADLDGDGDADVLSAARLRVSWYENLGNGAFSPPRIFTGDSATTRTRFVHAADLDGDGDPDVLSTSNDTISWHENLGGGAFAAPQTITDNAHGARSVYAADLDGDGDPDVLLASLDDDKIAWHENLGGGAFSSERVVTTDADGARSVHAADLDGDGDLDLLAASSEDDKVAWHENLGGGQFSAQQVIASDANGVRSVYAADLDGDGDADVLSASFDDGKIAWHENLSDHGDDHGNAPESATLATALPTFLHGTLESAGDRDVFRFAAGTGTLRVSSNGPTNTFGRLLNADGVQQASNDDSDSGLNFAISVQVSAGVHYIEVSGSANQATGSYTLSIAFVAKGHGGGFDAPREIAGSGFRDVVHATDLDGDGDPDLLSASESSGRIAWHENLGDGAFSAERVLADDADDVWSLHTADLDGDGDADVLFGSRFDRKIAWLENFGDRTFSAQRVVNDVGLGHASVRAADLDGDGDADVLSASYAGDESIVWYENRGGGDFSTQRIVARSGDPFTASAVDFDFDGDPDLLSASFSGIAWHENLGGGSFSAQRMITTEVDFGDAHAESVHSADLDGDGDPDVLSASGRDGKIAWYENEGGGAFSAQRVITGNAGWALSVHTADMDGDGDSDVLATSDWIAWHENEGGGEFSAQRVIDAGGALSVQAADLDGDGDPDVLAGGGDHDVAWHANLSDHGDDHGDAEESATLATALPAFMHGVLESNRDNDMFRFATGRGTLRVYTNGPTDTEGWLIDEEGELLAFDDRDGNFLIEAEVEAGVHYVDVFPPANETGAYTLSIEFVAADPVPDDHGDTPATATALSALPWFGMAELNTDSDRDVFRIDVPESGMLTVYTTDAGGGADTYGVLTDTHGTVLAEDDNSGDGSNFKIEVAVDDGIHYVEVRGVAGQPSGYYYLFIELTVETTVAVGSQQVIGTEADGAMSVYAADLDDDGDADVLTASRIDDKIAWHENLGGGQFSAQRVITTAADGARVVYAADLDGDGDADVLSASYGDDEIAWHENQGGGTFSAQQIITTGGTGAVSIHAADLDGDGDADVVGMSLDLAWYENMGGQGFSGSQSISSGGGSGGHGSVHAADLDGDGDQDVLATEGHDGVRWYENLGGASFSKREISRSGDVVYAADLDGDGDADVLVARSSSNVAVVSWHENLGGGAFSAERPITTLASGGQSVHAADLDGDGDMDVLSASGYDGKIAWYSNRGAGSFLGQQVIAVTNDAESVHTADLDGDGDPDVLSASQGDDTISWYENLSDHGDDHGDAPGAATLAATLPALLLGRVESSGDKDVFRVATGSGTLSVGSNGPTDTVGRLLDADGEELASNDDSDGVNFGIEADVAAGVHYVEVRGYSTRTGPYTLSIEFVAD